MTKRRSVISVMLLTTTIACASSSNTGLTGDITADGSSTVYPITQAIAEEFRNEQEAVRVSVGESGTGGGFKKFCNGETDISNASRPIKDEEKSICGKAGISVVELKVAIDGLSLLVNPANTWATCLTVDELKKIWQPKSAVKNWSQIRAGFPNKPLTLYGPGTSSGTFDYFTDEIVGEEGASRSDYAQSEDDNVLVKGISDDESALGYFGFAYYEQNKSKLKLLGVDAGGGCVTPDATTINAGTYKPLSRPLYIYVSKKAITRPEVVAFIDFYLENVGALLKDVGYIPLHADDFAASKRTWDGAKRA